MRKNELLRGFGGDMIVLVSFQKKLICQDFSLKVVCRVDRKSSERGQKHGASSNLFWGKKTTLLVRGARPSLDSGKATQFSSFFNKPRLFKRPHSVFSLEAGRATGRRRSSRVNQGASSHRLNWKKKHSRKSLIQEVNGGYFCPANFFGFFFSISFAPTRLRPLSRSPLRNVWQAT